jgi:hypothetical protein
MKTEITIDGITYKVGDVLEYKDNTVYDQTIVHIGCDVFLTEYPSEFNERLSNSIVAFSSLLFWKIKKPKKKVVVEFWVAMTKYGTYSIWSKYESIPIHREIIKTEHVRFEYEVDEE